MPFATVERTHKRFRSNHDSSDYSSYYFTPPFPEDEEDFGFDFQQPQQQQQQQPQPQQWNSFQPWGIHHNNKEAFSPMYPSNNTFLQSPRRYPGLGKKQAMGLNIDTNYLDTVPSLAASSPPTPLETSGSSVDSEPTTVSPSAVPLVPWTSDEEEEKEEDIAAVSKGGAAIQEVFSKFSLSYTDLGINMEARISSVSDFRVLIDAFSKMCCSPENEEKKEPPRSSGIVLYRNPNSRLKPVNFFASASYLGQIMHPHSKHSPAITLQQIVDTCLHTYFTCWVRYYPILSRQTFMAWYDTQPNPLDTLIVNALCSFAFRHTALHHGGPEWEHFRADPYQLQEQEEFFFNRARDCLGQSFDRPDRFTILSLIYMSIRAEVRRRHHYLGMAVSMLHELDIYPRMVYEAEDESYEKEADTRMWWLAWSIDLYLYSSGAPKNTPQTKCHGMVDIPRVFEEDIDDGELSVLSYHHCIQFWKMQADIIDMIDREHEMTVEQLNAYDQRIVGMYNSLPAYLKFDSGFEYGTEELFVACVRVNIEYNATRIILHKQFIPDVNDRYPGRFSLESLNICISVALTQIRALNTCVKISRCQCAFDRDEMWRTAEIISITMDIYRSCGSPLILTNVNKEEFDNALQKCLDILKQTVEHRSKAKDWVQVADWIEVEIRRHRLYTHPANNVTAHLYEQQPNKPDYFLANLKPSIALSQQQQPPKQEVAPVPVPQSRSEHDSHEITTSGSMLSVLSFPASSSPSSTSSTSSTSSSFIPSSSPDPAQPFVQCNMYAPPSKNINPSKSQTRFRYFNPRKMNKFLFIDENPIS